VASVDVYQTFMDRIVEVLMRKHGCDEDIAHDSATDAILSYTRRPERYDPGRRPLFFYLMQAAWHRAVDRLRSANARTQRELDFGWGVEQGSRAPNEEMEASVRARQLVDLLEKGEYLSERDRVALRLFLSGQGSTEEMAKALALPPMPTAELRREVKRHRDRLMKLLERFGKGVSDDES
jgi:RNA polymerase sigma-70 factor (ECF subfamily)